MLLFIPILIWISPVVHTIQIHLMLLFIHDNFCSVLNVLRIQIHLMLLFIFLRSAITPVFTSIQIHLMLLFIVYHFRIQCRAVSIQIHLMLLFIPHFCGFFRVIILHSSALYSLFTLFYQPLPYYCTSLSISSYFLLFSLLVKTLQLIFTW